LIENPGKILENLGKISENLGKNGAQPCLISYNEEKYMKTFFYPEVIPKKGLHDL